MPNHIHYYYIFIIICIADCLLDRVKMSVWCFQTRVCLKFRVFILKPFIKFTCIAMLMRQTVWLPRSLTIWPLIKTRICDCNRRAGTRNRLIVGELMQANLFRTAQLIMTSTLWRCDFFFIKGKSLWLNI